MIITWEFYKDNRKNKFLNFIIEETWENLLKKQEKSMISAQIEDMIISDFWLKFHDFQTLFGFFKKFFIHGG